MFGGKIEFIFIIEIGGGKSIFFIYVEMGDCLTYISFHSDGGGQSSPLSSVDSHICYIYLLYLL